MKKYLAIIALLPLPLLAAYVPLEPLPFVPSGSPSFPALLSGAFTLAIILGSAVAVLMITLGGIQYMTSEVLHEKEAGRERIKNAVLGLLLLLAIYLILSTINPQLLNFNLNVKRVGSEVGRSPSPSQTTGGGAQSTPYQVPSFTSPSDATLYADPYYLVVTDANGLVLTKFFPTKGDCDLYTNEYLPRQGSRARITTACDKYLAP